MLQDVISLLGIANPQLSFAWQDVNAPAADASAPFLLNSNAAGGEWMAPVAGLFNQAFAPNIFMGDGSAAAGTAWVLKMQPQVYTRLLRLYGRVIEGKTTQTDQPQRPVPMTSFFTTQQIAAPGPLPETTNRAANFPSRMENCLCTILRDNPSTRWRWHRPSWSLQLNFQPSLPRISRAVRHQSSPTRNCHS